MPTLPPKSSQQEGNKPNATDKPFPGSNSHGKREERHTGTWMWNKKREGVTSGVRRSLACRLLVGVDFIRTQRWEHEQHTPSSASASLLTFDLAFRCVLVWVPKQLGSVDHWTWLNFVTEQQELQILCKNMPPLFKMRVLLTDDAQVVPWLEHRSFAVYKICLVDLRWVHGRSFWEVLSSGRWSVSLLETAERDLLQSYGYKRIG